MNREDFDRAVINQFVKNPPRRMRALKWQRVYIAVHFKELSSLANQSYRALGRGAIIVDLGKGAFELNYLSQSDITKTQENQEYLDAVEQYNPDKEFLISFKSNYGKNANARLWTIPYSLGVKSIKGGKNQ